MRVNFDYHRIGVILIIFLAGFCLESSGQVALGAREIGMGQAASALPVSSWSVFSNPALMKSSQSEVSFFGIRYYGLENITDVAMAVSHPTKLGVIGGGAHRFGDDLYSEDRMRLGYKNSLAGFHYGLALNYYHVQQGGGYGSLATIGLDVGLAAEVTTNLWLGAKTANVNQPSYGSYNNITEEPPRDLSIGFSYRAPELFVFSADVYKDVRFPISYRTGIEIIIYEELVGRAGITTNPVTFAGGFGYESDFWGIDIVAQQHENPVLGLSPGLELSVTW